VLAWCKSQGYALAGPFWEVYGDWSDNPTEVRTDVFYLLK
jgi:effector-binding domain-containing protein